MRVAAVWLRHGSAGGPGSSGELAADRELVGLLEKKLNALAAGRPLTEPLMERIGVLEVVRQDWRAHADRSIEEAVQELFYTLTPVQKNMLAPPQSSGLGANLDLLRSSRLSRRLLFRGQEPAWPGSAPLHRRLARLPLAEDTGRPQRDPEVVRQLSLLLASGAVQHTAAKRLAPLLNVTGLVTALENRGSGLHLPHAHA